MAGRPPKKSAPKLLETLREMEAIMQNGRVEVALHPRAGQAVVEVTDNGEGIAEEARGKILHPFFTTKPTGTGANIAPETLYGLPVEAQVNTRRRSPNLAVHRTGARVARSRR
jgi:hypothetical protein